MDNYIVRIYRREDTDSQKIAGLVELIESDEKKAFTSYEELREILRIPGPGIGRSKRDREKSG